MDLKLIKDEIVALSNQRDKLSSDVQRMVIKREEAEKTLKELEEKCTSLGFDPSTLSSEILVLEGKCKEMMEEFKNKLASLELKLSNYKE